MALSTYSQLQGAVSDWINREGQTRVADWIALAEAGFNPQLARQTTLVGPFKLTDAAPANALLSEFPNLYLHAALVEAQGFLMDPEAMALAERGLAKAWSALTTQYGKGRTVGVLTVDSSLQPPAYEDPLFG